MKISIPTPCHEDWQKMTPTEKGAFCGVCQKDVIDFTQKTNAEIRSILISNSGEKLCGNFLKVQLDEGYDTYTEWENQSISTFRSKFLWACIFVFGMTLFSGCDMLTNNRHTVGEMQWIEPDSGTSNCTNTDEDILIGELVMPIENDSIVNSIESDSITNQTKNDSIANSSSRGDFSITTQVKGKLDLSHSSN